MISYRPVFIMGAPRSGTTLLASMLSTTENVIALPEMHYIYSLLYEETVFGKVKEQKVIYTLKSHPMFVDLDIGISNEEINNLVDKNIKTTIFNIINEYISCHKNNIKPTIWIEHSPNNHKYFNILRYVFPESKFIHIVRDGRAVYSSTKKTDWGYKDVIIGAIDWRQRVTECIVMEETSKNRVLTVKYEDVVENTKTVLKNICEFVSMSYNPSMINSGGIILPSFARFQNNANKKPNKNSKQKWKNNLKKYEIKHFTAFNYDLLNKYGYVTNQPKNNEIKGMRKYNIRLIGIIKEKYYKKKFKKRFDSILVNS